MGERLFSVVHTDLILHHQALMSLRAVLEIRTRAATSAALKENDCERIFDGWQEMLEYEMMKREVERKKRG
jgi:hypothetical protein